MPVPPHLQLFSNTGLSENPILSSLFVLSQMRQDKINQAKAEEQLALENERADEEFELRKAQLNNQTQQIQQTLEQNNINRRVADFQFRTGTQSVPEAIVAGTIPIPQALDPISSALAQVDRTGNVRPEGTPLGFTEQNPITGEDQFFGPDAISSILRAEQARQQQKIAPQLLRMHMDAERFRVQQIGIDQRHAEDVAARREIAAQSSADRQAQINATLTAARIRASGDDTLMTTSNLKELTDNGVRPVGVPSVDVNFWNNLSGTDRAILSGMQDPTKVYDRDTQAKFINAASQAGLVIPNVQPKDIVNYKNQKNVYLELLKTADEFARIAPAPPEGVGSRAIGTVLENTPLLGTRARNNLSVALLDNMTGFLASLKDLVGDSGVLTNQDIDRIKNILPTMQDSPSIRKTKLSQLRSYLSNKENAFFSSIPPAQRDFMFTVHGISQGSSGNEVKTPEDILNERKGTR